MISEFDIVKINLIKKKDKTEKFSFTVQAFDVGDFFDKFLKYFDNYDCVVVEILKDKKEDK